MRGGYTVDVFEIIIPRNRLNAEVGYYPRVGSPTTMVFPLGLFYTLHPLREGAVEIREGNGRNVSRRSEVARNGPVVSVFPREYPNKIIFSNGAELEVDPDLVTSVATYLSERAAAPDATYSESTPDPESVRFLGPNFEHEQVVLTSGGRRSRRRLMSRKYCKTTPCRKMGFTQKASCRPTKNCYRRTRRTKKRSTRRRGRRSA
jgi:hypothetical protein